MSVKDNLSMEYEARAMISEEQYHLLLSFHKEHAPKYKEIINVNSYFDTPNRDIVKNHMVLRIREIDEKEDELTLKIKGQDGDLEITHRISKDEKIKMKENGFIPSRKIREILSQKGIDISKVKFITTLKTERFEEYTNEYIFVIDKNEYNNIIDYNIEVESTSKEEAKKHLNELGALVGVTNQDNYISKSRRAILG